MRNPLVLFVCTGNICRSPMAEYLLRDALPEGSRWTVASAGTHAVDGLPASANAITVCTETGVDLRPHRSRALTGSRLLEANVILALARTHLDTIRSWQPDQRRKLFLLGSFDPHAAMQDVSDPIGADLAVYREARDTIRRSISGLVAFLESMELP